MALDLRLPKNRILQTDVRDAVNRVIIKMAALDEKRSFPGCLEGVCRLGYLGLRHEEKYGGWLRIPSPR